MSEDGRYRIPASLAIAFQTGRPELARISIGSHLTPEDLAELSRYAEDLVIEVQKERELIQIMSLKVDDMISQAKGMLSTLERFKEAFVLMNSSASIEDVRSVLANRADREQRG